MRVEERSTHVKKKTKAQVKCEHCGDPRIEGEYHAHCSDCGARIGRGRRHNHGCSRLDPREDFENPAYYCQARGCRRMLAVGVSCPEHGARATA